MSDEGSVGDVIELGNALRAWFRHAVGTCEYLSTQGLLDEQTTTGSFLGALAASYPLIFQEAGTGTASDFECFWLPYNTGTAANLWSEARHGADFGLVVLGTNGLARFSVFQAKQSAVRFDRDLKQWTLNIRHIVKDQSKKERAQMVALVEASLTSLACNGTIRPPIKERGQIGDLTWVHYVAYGPGSPVCIPLSGMEDAFLAEQNLNGTSNEVLFDPSSHQNLFQVLRSVEDASTPHWLDIKTKAMFDSLLAWIDVVPVFVATDREGWNCIPTNRRSNTGLLKTFTAINKRSPQSKPSAGGGKV